MRTRHLFAVVGISGALALGGAAEAVAVPGGTGARAADPAIASAVCDRLGARVAEVPGIQTRIRRRLEEIDARLAAVRDPKRRARLGAKVQPRLDALRVLDQRLTEQVARVEARCPGPA